MAGGKMALYTGLVKKIKPTDDELAQVLGHEIAHALAKHSAEKMSAAKVLLNFSVHIRLRRTARKNLPRSHLK
jgi:Zn-dependent protease with chaperone function